MTRTALVIRHVSYEDIAGFGDPIEAAGYTLDSIDATDPAFADIDLAAPDLVVLMGGPMGVYERDAHPWFDHEIARLQRRLDADRPTLGICLGSQIIAATLGADVYPGPVQEIGFHPVTLTDAGANTPLAALGDTPVLHWHGDTFDLPEDTEWLAASPLYPHQAFRRGNTLLALQFHAEMGLDPRIDRWIDNAAESLAGLGIDGATLRVDYDRLGPACVTAGQAMITRWLAMLP